MCRECDHDEAYFTEADIAHGLCGRRRLDQHKKLRHLQDAACSAEHGWSTARNRAQAISELVPSDVGLQGFGVPALHGFWEILQFATSLACSNSDHSCSVVLQVSLCSAFLFSLYKALGRSPPNTH